MSDEKQEQHASEGSGSQQLPSGLASQEPAGLGAHKHGLAAEYASEQGWGTQEEQRTKPPLGNTAGYGGKDYAYGAADFGDRPVDQQGIQPAPETMDFLFGEDEDATDTGGDTGNKQEKK